LERSFGGFLSIRYIGGVCGDNWSSDELDNEKLAHAAPFGCRYIDSECPSELTTTADFCVWSVIESLFASTFHDADAAVATSNKGKPKKILCTKFILILPYKDMPYR
jgi:hypothetical protein